LGEENRFRSNFGLIEFQNPNLKNFEDSLLIYELYDLDEQLFEYQENGAVKDILDILEETRSETLILHALLALNRLTSISKLNNFVTNEFSFKLDIFFSFRKWNGRLH
jgi:hypothetical protein